MFRDLFGLIGKVFQILFTAHYESLFGRLFYPPHLYKTGDPDHPGKFCVDFHVLYLSRIGTLLGFVGVGALLVLFVWGLNTVHEELKEKDSLVSSYVFAGVAFYFFTGFIRSVFLSHLEIDMLEERVYVLGMMGINKYETPGGYDFETGKPEFGFNPRNVYLVTQGKHILLARLFSKSGAEKFAGKLRDAKNKINDDDHDAPGTLRIKGKGAIFNFWIGSFMEKGITLVAIVGLLDVFSENLFHFSIVPFGSLPWPPSP